MGQDHAHLSEWCRINKERRRRPTTQRLRRHGPAKHYAWPSAELMSRLSAIDPAQARAARGEPFPFASKKNTGESDSELMLTRWCPAARSIDIAGHGGR